MSRSLLILWALCAGASMAGAMRANAHEGMWMPRQLPGMAKQLEEAGLELSPDSFEQLHGFPLGAVVSLGGCTGSFVSPRGLLVTNHHCAYGSIQYNSSAQRNLIKNGFLAASLDKELRAAPGTRVFVTVEMRDVTEQILDTQTAGLAGKTRSDAVEANKQRIAVAACAQASGYRCDVREFFDGLEYWLIRQLEIRDVRLVYAPAEGVGKFGGETDNWTWPRHTGDFSFFRAYVGPDGKPADFSADNVPYQPSVHFSLARQGVSKGDFVMLAGYPGRTSRYRLPQEVAFAFQWSYPSSIRLAEERRDIITRETWGNTAAAIAYASTLAGINNSYKKTQGLLLGYSRSDLLARKQAEWKALNAWVLAEPRRKALFAADLSKLDELVAQRNAIARRETLLRYISPRLLDAARTLYSLATEKAKSDDLARKPGFQQRDWQQIEDGLEAIDKRYDEQVDKALVAHSWLQYLQLPAQEQNTAFLAALNMKPGMTEAAIRSRLDGLYASSRLADKATRVAWLKRDVTAFDNNQDSFIRVAVALHADDTARENRDKQLEGELQRRYRSYMSALVSYRRSTAQAVYPDANGTLRIAFGKVAGRHSDVDGVDWSAFTTVRGVLAKHTGQGEFDAPAEQVAAIKNRQFDRFRVPGLDSVPVDFLSTLDMTGGNSGSAVLNSRGELVGLAFDHVLDSVISDWSFDPNTVRTIAVDVRYMLWQMEVIDHADRLLQEMRAP